MKVAALAALGALIVLPAEAVERHGGQGSPAPALDANGNTADVVISGKTGARARGGIAYAARYQAYIDDLEINHGTHLLSPARWQTLSGLAGESCLKD
jgi:hypothetical protein